MSKKTVVLTKKRIVDSLQRRIDGRRPMVVGCAVIGVLHDLTGAWSNTGWIKEELQHFPDKGEGERKPKLVKGEFLACISLKYETAIRAAYKRYYGMDDAKKEALKKTLAYVNRYLPEDYRETVRV